MSLPWSKVDNEWILAQRDERMRQPARACSEIEVMAEVAAMYSTGRLAKTKRATLARSFGWSPSRLTRALDRWAAMDAVPWVGEQQADSLPLWWRPATIEGSRKVAANGEQQANSKRTASDPLTRALPSESKKETESEKNNTPAKPAVDPVVSDVWSKLEAIRKQHEPKARTWPKTGETANKRRKAIKARLKALNSDGHEDPIQTMLDTASWLYGPTDSFKAKGCRKGGIDSMLRPSNMLELTNIRLDEQANPNKTNGRPQRTGKTLSPSIDDLLGGSPERVVLDVPLQLEMTNGNA